MYMYMYMYMYIYVMRHLCLGLLDGDIPRGSADIRGNLSEVTCACVRTSERVVVCECLCARAGTQARRQGRRVAGRKKHLDLNPKP